MRLFGLIGYPLGHSFSANFFKQKFENEGLVDSFDYRNFAIESVDLIRGILEQNTNLDGFNVTIPYKEQIIPYLDAIDPAAKAIGAVNCVKITDGKLCGYNTDCYGFSNSLDRLIEGAPRPLKALVLGSGGASKAIKYALTERYIEFKMVSRTLDKGDITYDTLSADVVSEHKLIINTTPLGTYPNNHTYPEIAYDGIGEGHMLFDVVYNPSLTRFLEFGQQRGAKVLNGSEMLVDQAIKSWEIWQHA